MLFSTLNQGQVFLVFLYFGILLGIAFKIVNIFTSKLKIFCSSEEELDRLLKTKNTKKLKCLKKQKITKLCYHTTWVVFCILASLLFGVVCYFYNFGQIRLFCIIGYLAGFTFSLVLWKKIKTLIIKYKLKHILKK